MRFPDMLPDTLRDACAFLRAELAPFPGRINVMMRAMLTSAMVIVVSLTLEVPELPLSLLVVFFVTQANVVLTRLVGLLFIVGSTLAIGSSILLLKYTFDYPLMRIVIASVLFFGSVYLMRVLKTGVVFFIVAIVIIYVQSFVDQTDQAELLVRALLWVWVAVNYAIALTLAINTLLLPAEPQRQLKAEIQRQLNAVDNRLAHLAGAREPAPITLQSVQHGAITLQKLLKFAAMRDRRYRETRAWHLASIATVSRLYLAASTMQAPREALPASGRAMLDALRANCRALAAALASDTPYRLVEDLPLAAASTPGAIAEMRQALRGFAGVRLHGEPENGAQAQEPMIAADAWTNPTYARFSLKTLLAVLISYTFYNATDWQGIHTIMLTCLIVALPSLGASTQRALLRVAGALGGSALALMVVVFVIPGLDSIVGLLLTVLPIAAAAAWIAAGSERIAYAGVQLLFTFSLAVLGQFGPSTHLTEIRDRMVGILLGVAVATVVQIGFWREGEGDTLRAKLAQVLHPLAALLRTPQAGATHTAPEPYAQQQLQTWSALADCEAMLARVAVEPGWEEGEAPRLTVRAQSVLAQARAIMLAGNALRVSLDGARTPDAAMDALRSVQDQIASCIDRYADALSGSPPAARRPPPIALPALPGDAAHAPRWSALRRLANEVEALPDWDLTTARASANIEAGTHDAAT
ncbi:FUSC family protein [Paraburkholderia sp. J76]|uniref:FUSC family protein n=1 Tax=Paraburkholderia sp. J76 TaxID=2805439 RepID=UPI002ABD83A5|nr:FUSC family protein [Paraburkholderia sp. J76]